MLRHKNTVKRKDKTNGSVRKGVPVREHSFRADHHKLASLQAGTSVEHENLVSNKFPSQRDSTADVSSVSPSSERIKGLWAVCGYIGFGS